MTITVRNPVPGGSRFMSLKTAERHVSRGRAAFNVTRTEIQFILPAQIEAMSAAASEALSRRITGTYYERGITRLMEQTELRRIPFTGHRQRLYEKGSDQYSVHGRNGRPRIILTAASLPIGTTVP